MLLGRYLGRFSISASLSDVLINMQVAHVLRSSQGSKRICCCPDRGAHLKGKDFISPRSVIYNGVALNASRQIDVAMVLHSRSRPSLIVCCSLSRSNHSRWRSWFSPLPSHQGKEQAIRSEDGALSIPSPLFRLAPSLLSLSVASIASSMSP